MADLLEAILHFEHQKVSPHRSRTPTRLRFARCCYDHLAGELGVLLFGSLLQQNLLEAKPGGLALTSAGEHWLSSVGVDLGRLTQTRRPLLRPCLDGSERRSHLAGAVGAALLDRFLALRWLIRAEGRELHLTALGQQQLEQRLEVKLQAAIQAQ